MQQFLAGYHVNDATWFYLSLILIVAVFFRFNRVWSLRNLDLLLLTTVSFGFLFEPEIWLESKNRNIDTIRDLAAWKHSWLFTCTGLILLRLFLDPVFRRRPLLEQNLNSSGLIFLCIAAFGFQIANVASEPPSQSTVAQIVDAQHVVDGVDPTANKSAGEATAVSGPGMRIAGAASEIIARATGVSSVEFTARLLACLSHLAVVLGLVFLGRKHLGDKRLGVAMASIYLLIPCTAYNVSQVDHVLPAALVVWAFLFFNKPMVAGVLLGLASGMVFFPVFLLPLWAIFYGRQGALRFSLALAIVAAVMISTFALTSFTSESFVTQFLGSIDWSVLQFGTESGTGFWLGISQAYRLPVVIAFVVMVVLLSVFPRKKNIEHLMAHSAAIVVATQLWYPQSGGTYVLWYLPLVLTVVFRPRLEHLVPPESTSLLKLARNSHNETRENRQFTSTRQQLR
jgi:hypothetical protein